MITESMMNAVEVAEKDMKPLALKADHSVHFQEEFKVSEADVAVLSSKYLSLKIAGAVDKKGYDLVHAGRMEVREVRTHIEKTRKRLKEQSLEYGRAVDAEAKRITNMIAPVEAYLLAEETRVDDEINAIKAAKQKALDERNQSRMDALLAVGATIGLAAVVTMDDQAYVDYLALVTKDFEARKKFEAEQESERVAKAKAEAERIAKIEADNAKQKAENEALQAQLKAQQDLIDKANADAARAKRDEEIRKETEEKAEAKRVKEQAEEVQRLAVEAEKQKAKDAAKPDAEKLKFFADKIANLKFPEMVTPDGIAAIKKITQATFSLEKFVIGLAENLTK